MAASTPALGDLQTQIMSALWRIEAGTVEEVRSALPPRYRGAYNTIQTVLSRLTERGLLSRHRRGNAFEYRPRLSEADYLSRSIATTLAGASSGARQAALAQLIGGLDQGELEQLKRLARDAEGGSRKSQPSSARRSSRSRSSRRTRLTSSAWLRRMRLPCGRVRLRSEPW